MIYSGAMEFPKIVPELYCSDIERSLAFYTDTLGFCVLFSRPEERFFFLDREGAQIMIEQSVGRVFFVGELRHPYGRGINLQIEVSNVEALYETVKKTDSRIHIPLENKWYRRDEVLLGNRQFVVLDPDGYLLRFFESLGSKLAQG